MKALLVRLVREEAGQDLIEYALLAAFVAALGTGAVLLLSPAITGAFQKVVDAMK